MTDRDGDIYREERNRFLAFIDSKLFKDMLLASNQIPLDEFEDMSRDSMPNPTKRENQITRLLILSNSMYVTKN